jgi:type IV secretion system protein VirB4
MVSSENKEIVSYSAFADFVPFAFYYDHDSVITKNGELIKIIKLNKSASNTDIKKIISSFISSLDGTDISIWLTTIRSSNSKNFRIDNTLSKNVLLEKFEKRKQELFDVKFLEDEFYISIVINDRVNLITLKNIASVISTFNRNSYHQRLQIIYKRLSKITTIAFDKLLEFNPTILSIVEVDGEYISEIESFFSRINRSSSSPIKLDKHDISARLIQYGNIRVLENKIAFNHAQDDELFCSTFSVKNHSPLTEEMIKNLLDNQFEMTITEVIIPKYYLEKKYN